MNNKKLALLSILLIAAFVLAACGPTENATQVPVATEAQAAAPTTAGPTTAAAQSGGEVYYLNFKPEVADVYQKIADEY